MKKFFLKKFSLPLPLPGLWMVLILFSCNTNRDQENNAMGQANGQAQDSTDVATTEVGQITLPAPDTTHDAEKRSNVIGWSDEGTPKAPAGFTVTKFADDLKHPRNIYVAPNHDIFVAESDDENKSANRITLLRDTNQDGEPENKRNVPDRFKTALRDAGAR